MYLISFYTENISDEEFFNIKIEKLCEIFKGDINLFSVFLPLFNQEKIIFTQQNILKSPNVNGNENISLMDACVNENGQQYATPPNEIVNEFMLNVIDQHDIEMMETSSDLQLDNSSSNLNLEGLF